MNIYTPIYVKQIINKDVMDSTGNSIVNSLSKPIWEKTQIRIYIFSGSLKKINKELKNIPREKCF